MPPILEERFQLLLSLAKDPKFHALAMENLAAARELVDTLLATGHLMEPSYKAYRLMCTTAAIIISTERLARSVDLPKTYMSLSDGIRATQVTQ